MKLLQSALPLILASLFSTSSLAIDVLAACKESSPSGSIVLLDLSCPSANECWPDPDDVYIEFTRDQGPTQAVNDMVWLDAKGRVSKGPSSKSKPPFRAIWDMSQHLDIKSRKARLGYDGQAITRSFELSDGCRDFPAAALKALDISWAKPYEKK